MALLYFFHLVKKMRSGNKTALKVMFLLAVLAYTTQSSGQSKKDYKKEMGDLQSGFVTKKLGDSLIYTAGADGQYYFDFGNVNKIPYYKNASKLNSIKSLKKSAR